MHDLVIEWEHSLGTVIDFRATATTSYRHLVDSLRYPTAVPVRMKELIVPLTPRTSTALALYREVIAGSGIAGSAKVCSREGEISTGCLLT